MYSLFTHKNILTQCARIWVPVVSMKIQKFKDLYDFLERKIPLTLTPFWDAIGISEDINSW